MEPIMMTLNQAEFYATKHSVPNIKYLIEDNRQIKLGDPVLENSFIVTHQVRDDNLAIKVSEYYCEISTKAGKSSAHAKYVEISLEGKVVLRARKDPEQVNLIDSYQWKILYQRRVDVPTMDSKINDMVTKSLEKA